MLADPACPKELSITVDDKLYRWSGGWSGIVVNTDLAGEAGGFSVETKQEVTGCVGADSFFDD